MDAMDWEPEIPGQWNTPLRYLHQLGTTQTASSNAYSQAETPTLKDYFLDWKPELRAELNRSSRKRAAAEAGILETVLDSGAHLPTATVQPFDLRTSVFAPITNIVATTFHIFIQIYSTTLQSVGINRESVLAATGPIHVIEERRTAADGFQSLKRRAIDSGRSEPVISTTQQLSRNKRSTSHRSIARSSRRQGGSHQMASLGESTAKSASNPSGYMSENTPSPHKQSGEPQASREALGVQLWASFTPAPISGVRDSLAVSQQTSNLLTPSAGEPDISISSQGMVLRPPIDKPEYGKIMSAKFDRPDRSPRIKPSLKSPLIGHELRKLSSNINSGSSSLQNRRSLPQLSDSEISSQLTRSHTISETPSRRARFAINPFNGQPQENSVKFYKDSKIGEWAPSSPWVDEQNLALTSDLKHNLDALLREDPVFDPVSAPLPSASKSSTSDVNVPFVPDEGFISPPQDKGESIQVSPMSPSDSDQQTTADRLVNESRTAQAPNTPLFTDSSFSRIKELVTGSFRKVFSPPSRGLLSDHVNTNPVQEITEDPVKNPDIRSRIGESNHVSRICDSPGDRDNHNSELIPNHINSNLHDGEQELRKDFTGSDGSKDSDIVVSKNDMAYVDLEVGMSKLRMSTFAKEKLGRKRMEREAAAAKRKAAEEAAAAKARADAEAAERKASSHRRSPKEKLVKPLSEDWEARIGEAMSKGESVALTTTVSGTELRRKDLVTVLGARQWLNDEIINAYLEWIVDYANRKAGKSGRNAIPKAIAHNSFFYKNIATQGPQSVSRWMKRKKAEGKKLLDVDIVLIPVNNASHWTIIVVSPKDRTIEYLDSFSGPSKVFIKHTKEWLAVELGLDWHEEEWRVLNTRSAEQLNGFDCGVFLLTNAECVVGGIATDSYDWNDMAAQRHRIAAVLLNRGFGNDIVPAEEL